MEQSYSLEIVRDAGSENGRKQSIEGNKGEPSSKIIISLSSLVNFA